MDLDSVRKDSYVSLARELKKMIGTKDLEISKLANLVSRMMLIFRDEEKFKPERFLKALDFLLGCEDLWKSEVAEALRLKEAFSRYREIMANGDILEKTALGCYMSYGGLSFGTSLDNVVKCARSLSKLLCEARKKNRKRVAQLTREYYRDLLRSPRPASEIPRGFSGADLARMLYPRFEKTIEADKETLSRTIGDALPVIESYLEGLKSKDYFRQEMPKYLNGYKDLVEGDFNRFLDWIVALNRIARGKQTSYKRLSRQRRGIDLIEKVDEVKKSSRAILVKSYNRHLRNAIAHTSYRIHLEREEIEFRDREWKKEMTFIEFKRLLSEMSAVLELSLVLSDPEDRKLEERLSRHRDPGWWERIESRRGLLGSYIRS